MPDNLRSKRGKDWENKPANKQLSWYTILNFSYKWMVTESFTYAWYKAVEVLLEAGSTIKNND